MQNVITDEQKNRIALLYERGMPLKDITAEVGCSVSTVSKVARAYGMRRNGRAPVDGATPGDTPEQIRQCLACTEEKCRAKSNGCPLWR